MQELLIGICDDEEKERETIRLYCEQCLQELGQSASFVLFSSGEEILDYRGSEIQILFLDVEMSGMNGLQVIRQLEQSDIVWRVVFVTSHQEAVFDSFGIRTLGFERKPVPYEGVRKWIGIALRELQKNELIECGTSEGKRWIRLEEVWYIEAQRNYVKVWLGDGHILANGNLKEWEDKLADHSFIRIHKTYLMNPMYIRTMKNSVVLKDGSELPIGRAYKNHAIEQYHGFIFKIAEGRIG